MSSIEGSLASGMGERAVRVGRMWTFLEMKDIRGFGRWLVVTTGGGGFTEREVDGKESDTAGALSSNP